MERRLAAILAADMVGYSRFIEADEVGTIARLKVLREEVIDPSIAKHIARIVKTTGDGILVEFRSVVDAVCKSAEVQRALEERGAIRLQTRLYLFPDDHQTQDLATCN